MLCYTAEEFYYLDDSRMPEDSQSIIQLQHFAHMGFIIHVELYA